MRIHLICALVLFVPAAWAASGLTYSTYLREGFTPAAIATDSTGNVYLAGSTSVSSSENVATVVKLDPTGTQYLYVRTIAGSVSEAATGIVVDISGDAYVTGTTSSPDFLITPGRQTGTLPVNGTRAFLVELDPQGELLFSDVLGNVSTTGLAVALAADGGILVSGTSNKGLVATPGAYNVADTTNRPFLMKLDAAGANILFTVTGIGGDALAVDAAGNIYMAGSTGFTDYPTTPGSYQPVLNPVFVCFFPCQLTFPGSNQYLTKVDPAGSKLIYSTGVAGNSQTLNHGLAVDAEGNAYLTGVAYGEYNWTVAPQSTALVEPFLTEIDAAGAHAVYSMPIGGAGVALGSQGDVYVGGSYNDINFTLMPGLPPVPLPLGVASVPTRCQENGTTTFSEAYVSHVDAATGNVLSTVLVDGSNASAAGVAFAGGSSLWIAGGTSQPDAPITPGAIVATGLEAGTQPGAYLGLANFNLNQSGGPQVACILDGANDSRVSVVAPGQLLTLFGSGLGPATGVAATNNSTISIGGVTVMLGGMPAPILYASSTQINLAVPNGLTFSNSQGEQNIAPIAVSVNGVAAPVRELPVVPSNPSLFADLSGTISSCTVGGTTVFGSFDVFALNADGSVNSCQHGAAPGSAISLFLNGLGVDYSFSEIQPWTPVLIPVVVTIGNWSAEVVNVTQQSPFVWRVDVKIPETAPADTVPFELPVSVDMNFFNGVLPVGPLSVQPSTPSYNAPGTPLTVNVWVSP